MTSEPISDAIFLHQELSVDFKNLFGLLLVPGEAGKTESFMKTSHNRNLDPFLLSAIYCCKSL